MITVKSERELERMRAAGAIVAEVLSAAEEWVRPGVSTAEIDRRAAEIIRRRGATPSFLGYKGFPASICASINEEVVHGIPSERRVLREGDLFLIDVGACWRKYHADAARTLPVGKVSAPDRALLEATRGALARGVAQVRPGRRVSDIARAVERDARALGYDLVRKYGGHGIGTRLHEDPHVPNVEEEVVEDVELVEGMVLAIEPMLTAGGGAVRTLRDGWTVVTADGKRSAHFEDTVAVTADGPEPLTCGPAAAVE